MLIMILALTFIITKSGMPQKGVIFLSILMGLNFMIFLGVAFYAFKLKRYFVVLDDEGIHIPGKRKVPWTAVTKLSLSDERPLVLRYMDSSILESKEMKIGRNIYGFPVAVMRIIALVPDDAEVRVPRDALAWSMIWLFCPKTIWSFYLKKKRKGAQEQPEILEGLKKLHQEEADYEEMARFLVNKGVPRAIADEMVVELDQSSDWQTKSLARAFTSMGK